MRRRHQYERRTTGSLAASQNSPGTDTLILRRYPRSSVHKLPETSPQGEPTSDCNNPNGDLNGRIPFGYRLVESQAPLASRNDGDDHAYSMDDINQSLADNCWLLATLGSIVQRVPRYIQSLVENTIDSEGRPAYRVKLYLRPGAKNLYDSQQHCYVVNRRMPRLFVGSPYYDGVRSSGDGTDLWPAILSKAIAIAFSGDMVAVSSVERGRGNFVRTAIHALLGPTPLSSIVVSDDADDYEAPFARLVRVFDAGHVLVASCCKSESGTARPMQATMTDSHAYTVTDVDPELETVTVRDPWGHNAPASAYQSCSKREFFDYFKKIHIAELTEAHKQAGYGASGSW